MMQNFSFNTLIFVSKCEVGLFFINAHEQNLFFRINFFRKLSRQSVLNLFHHNRKDFNFNVK